MKHLLVLCSAALVAGVSSSAAQPGAVLTLNGPKATMFGHTVDFAGRLVPAAAGTSVTLYSGRSYVATTGLRSDGSYRFKVKVGKPGPFRAVAGAVTSRAITVRVHPFLRTKLAGPRVVGERLSVAVRLQPTAAGRLHVRVLRGGELRYGRLVTGHARIRLDTRTPEPLRLSIQSVPAVGYARVGNTLHVGLRAPALTYGRSSPLVPGMLARLSALGYVTPSPRSLFDGDVQQSVYAFQKAQRLPRTGIADAAFWLRLANPRPVVPRYPTAGDHLEIDKTRQVLLVVRGGRATEVIPVSTAGIAGYYTPEGRFAIGRKVAGYDPSPLGVLYKPMYFYGGYAIHGNPSVPPYPASHGCVRVPNYVADRLFASEPFGEPVIVYS
jgi:N-acetylmuramoyl-L-alanine amidase